MDVISRVWYEVCVKYIDSGKKVGRKLCVAGDSFGDAEIKAHDYFAKLYDAGIDVCSVKRVDYVDYVSTYINDNESSFFKAVVTYVTVNERTGKEKKSRSSILVMANDIDYARLTVILYMDHCTVDYVISSIKETDIYDIIYGD